MTRRRDESKAVRNTRKNKLKTKGNGPDWTVEIETKAVETARNNPIEDNNDD